MKKFVTALMCLILIFACVQMPVYASESSDESSVNPRLSYINDAQINIYKQGSNIRVAGYLYCKTNLTSNCTITVTVYSRDKGSSDSWTIEKITFGNGTTSCGSVSQTPYDSTKEYRGKIYCSVHPIGGGTIEHLTLYTDPFTP